MAIPPAVEPLAIGVVGGIVAERAHEIAENVGPGEKARDEQLETLKEIAASLKRLVKFQTPDDKPDLLEEVGALVAGVETQIFTKGYKHFMIFVVTNSNVQFRTAIGDYLTTLQAGWNLIDLPGVYSVQMQPSQPQTNVVFRMSDESMGNPV